MGTSVPRPGRRAALASLLVLLAIAVAAVAPYLAARTAAAQGYSFPPPSGSMTLAGATGITYTNNFNPFATTTSLPNEIWDLMFEPLIMFNPITGAFIPWLASNFTFTTAYMWENVSGKMVKVPTLAIIFWLRRGVTFANGDPFNATDVWYTFGLDEAYKVSDSAIPGPVGTMIANITILGPYEIEIIMNSNQSLNFLFIASTRIVDALKWEKVWPLEQLPNGTIIGLNKTSPATTILPINSPLINGSGTGPYLPFSFSPQMVTFVANPHYWIPGEPHIKWLYFPAYPSTSALIDALLAGQITWTNVIIPNINQTFVAKNPEYYHYVLTGIAFPVDFFLNYQKWPLSDPVLRQAISMAINRTAIDYIAEYGYEPPAIDLPVPPSLFSEFNSTVLYWAQYFAPPEGNVTRAIDWLEAHGWKFVNGQLYAPNGTDVSQIQMTIIEPSGWTDYDESAVLIADELKAIGLNVVPETVPSSTWWSDLVSDNYWMTRFWGMGAVPVAAQQFFARLSPKTTTAAQENLGGFMFINLTQWPFFKFLDPAMEYWMVNETLYDYYINKVGMLWVESLPSISLVYPYSPYEYVNETVTGFPTQSHNYWASYWLIGWTATLLCLHPVNETVPEPWWYYFSAYSMSQVPPQWVTSNDPYITVTTTTPVTTTTTTTTTTATTTMTTTSVVTSIATSTYTVVSTVISTLTTTVTRYVTSATYLAIAVVVTAIVVGLAVWAATRR